MGTRRAYPILRVDLCHNTNIIPRAGVLLERFLSARNSPNLSQMLSPRMVSSKLHKMTSDLLPGLVHADLSADLFFNRKRTNLLTV
jgi:hypothetical protein